MSLRLQRRTKAPERRSEAVILFLVAGRKFAISATAVEEIRSMDGARALPASAATARLPKVRQTVEREHHLYYVVDANAHFLMMPSKPNRVLLLRRSSSALSVDAIDRMTEIDVLHRLPWAFQGDERRWYRGLAWIDEQVVPVIDPGALLSKGEMAILEGTLIHGGQQSAGVVTV